VTVTPAACPGTSARDGSQYRIIQRTQALWQTAIAGPPRRSGRYGPGRQAAGGHGCPLHPSRYSDITLGNEGDQENARVPAVLVG